MSSLAGRAHALKEREPFLIRFVEERHAAALVGALDGIASCEVHRNGGMWEVLLDGAKADGMVVRVLEAIRNVLAGDVGASAQILLDGRKYVMQAE
jgi:hypothetical protein